MNGIAKNTKRCLRGYYMDIDDYLKEIEVISQVLLERYLVCNDPLEWFNAKGLDESIIAKISELTSLKKHIILQEEENEAKANWIEPIDALDIPYEKRIIMRSIYFEAEKLIHSRIYMRKFEKYECNHPIFVDTELFQQVRNKELIEYKNFHLYYENTIQYKNKYLCVDFLDRPILNYIDQLSKHYKTFVRINPYVVNEGLPALVLKEHLIIPLKYRCIENLTLYNGESTGSHYVLHEDEPCSTDYLKQKSREEYRNGIRSLEVSVGRNNDGNLHMMLEEVNCSFEYGTKYISTKCIHLDTDDKIGTPYTKSVLNHIDLAINVYSEEAFQIRKNQKLKDGKIEDATFRTHLLRLEKVPFTTLFDLANLFFGSAVLVKNWLDDLKLQVIIDVPNGRKSVDQ